MMGTTLKSYVLLLYNMFQNNELLREERLAKLFHFESALTNDQYSYCFFFFVFFYEFAGYGYWSYFLSTVELQWLEHWWLVYHGCFELVLESLGKIPLLQIWGNLV